VTGYIHLRSVTIEPLWSAAIIPGWLQYAGDCETSFCDYPDEERWGTRAHFYETIAPKAQEWTEAYRLGRQLRPSIRQLSPSTRLPDLEAREQLFSAWAANRKRALDDIASTFSYDERPGSTPDTIYLLHLANSVQDRLGLKTLVRLQKLAEGGFHKVGQPTASKPIMTALPGLRHPQRGSERVLGPARCCSVLPARQAAVRGGPGAVVGSPLIKLWPGHHACVLARSQCQGAKSLGLRS
jgi:hypothetical protein